MNIVITKRQHVWVSYGILFVSFALLFAAIILPPIVERVAFASRLDDLRSVYARSASVIAAGKAAEQALDRLAAAADANRDALFHAETDALAAADLQNDLKALIESNAGTLVSSAFRRRSESFPLELVTVAVRLRCSVESLARILLELETHQPEVFVENVAIQSRHRPGRELRDVAEELNVEFDVTGYLAYREPD